MDEKRLEARFSGRLNVNYDLDRTMVSFQANKAQNGHRWCKYKEGFSASLMYYVLDRLRLSSGHLLDPFAGSGTALFAASDYGIDGTGIELLPHSIEIIATRNMLRNCNHTKMAAEVRSFRDGECWKVPGISQPFRHLCITSGAFPVDSEQQLGRFLYESGRVASKGLQRVLRFAAMCVLEDISYTRKDGQYLRWDCRSGRRAGRSSFKKGPILRFGDAIRKKLTQISDDISVGKYLFPPLTSSQGHGQVTVLSGSCLDILPKLETGSFSAVITSPPYCNRYDYTRTYALELAMLGANEDKVRNLRQTMLSCTVENRAKTRLDKTFSESVYSRATRALEEQDCLQRILSYLDTCRQDRVLNNTGIPRMVRNYFLEMSLVIFECARVLAKGAPFVMVNDNVRYQGAHVPVDLILSEMAQAAGFEVETIWVLPRGKGNSSQQMRLHGRRELRKCVYVWRLTG